MKRYITILAIALGVFLEVGGQTNYPKESENTIRLMTYNTMYCKGNKGPASFEQGNIRRLASVLKEMDVDVVALQELDSACNGRGKRFLLDEIKKESGIDYQVIYGASTGFDGGSIGCGVLVKKSLQIKKIKKIALPGDEPRTALKVELDDFVFIGTHLDLNDDKRKLSASIIVNEVDSYTKKPTFLAGDLNDSHKWGSGGIAFPTLMDIFEVKSSTDGTLPGQPNQTIDYILYCDKNKNPFEFIRTNVVKGIETNGAALDLADVSDHYPVFLDIEPLSLSVKSAKKNEVRVKPLPANGIVYFDLEVEIQCINLYSISGSLVGRESICKDNSIDISRYSSGIYLAEILSDQGERYYARIIRS